MGQIGKNAVIFGVRNDMSIALHVADSLRAQGANVAIPYIPETKGEVLGLANQYGFDADLCQEVDVTNETQLEAYVKHLEKNWEGVDYLLHGVAFGNSKVMCSRSLGENETLRGRFIDIPFEDLMASFDASAYSLLRISRVFENFLRDQASILSLTYLASSKVFASYGGMAINKAALENITIYLAEHFGSRGIRVNTISAGFIMTTSAAGVRGARALRKITKQVAPLGNIKASDVADSASYYFSDLSKKVTGNIHFVDGGFNIMGGRLP